MSAIGIVGGIRRIAGLSGGRVRPDREFMHILAGRRDCRDNRQIHGPAGSAGRRRQAARSKTGWRRPGARQSGSRLASSIRLQKIRVVEIEISARGDVELDVVVDAALRPRPAAAAALLRASTSCASLARPLLTFPASCPDDDSEINLVLRGKRQDAEKDELRDGACGSSPGFWSRSEGCSCRQRGRPRSRVALFENPKFSATLASGRIPE